jgi:hypothetical protein
MPGGEAASGTRAVSDSYNGGAVFDSYNLGGASVGCSSCASAGSEKRFTPGGREGAVSHLCSSGGAANGCNGGAVSDRQWEGASNVCNGGAVSDRQWGGASSGSRGGGGSDGCNGGGGSDERKGAAKMAVAAAACLMGSGEARLSAVVAAPGLVDD